MSPLRPLVLALALAASTGAMAADFDGPFGPPPDFRRPRPPVFVPPPPGPSVQGPEENCRVFFRRRPGPFGDIEVRRVRICDDGPIHHAGPRWSHDEPPAPIPGRFERPPLSPEDEPEE